MVKHFCHAVIISLRRIKSACGDKDVPHTAHVIPCVMAPASISALILAHKRKAHRQLSVYEIFQKPRNIKIIKGETPHNQFGLKHFLNHLLHVVLYAT